GNVLYGCAPNASGFAFGASTDGLIFAGLLKFQRNITGPLSCPSGTDTHDLCEPKWPDVAMQLGIDTGGAGGGGGGAGAGAGGGAGQGGPAGTSGATAPGGGGCGCQAGGQVAAGAGIIVGLALLGLFLRRAR